MWTLWSPSSPRGATARLEPSSSPALPRGLLEELGETVSQLLVDRVELFDEGAEGCMLLQRVLDRRHEESERPQVHPEELVADRPTTRPHAVAIVDEHRAVPQLHESAPHGGQMVQVSAEGLVREASRSQGRSDVMQDADDIIGREACLPLAVHEVLQLDNARALAFCGCGGLNELEQLA